LLPIINDSPWHIINKNVIANNVKKEQTFITTFTPAQGSSPLTPKLKRSNEWNDESPVKT
jgi:hypothetical protein